MNGQNLLIWNVRGLNARARRNVVSQIVSLEKVSLLKAPAPPKVKIFFWLAIHDERFATMPAWLLPRIRDERDAWVAAGFAKLAPLIAAWSQNSFM
jgi:hypothetical protein